MSLHSVVLVCSAELFTYTPKSNSSSSSNILHLLQGYATPSLRSTSVVIADSATGDILSIAQMRLVVLVSVKDCRRKNEQITSRARNEMIKSSLVIVKATIGRNAPSQSLNCENRVIGAWDEGSYSFNSSRHFQAMGKHIFRRYNVRMSCYLYYRIKFKV